jgi:hypothetical protein
MSSECGFDIVTFWRFQRSSGQQATPLFMLQSPGSFWKQLDHQRKQESFLGSAGFPSFLLHHSLVV